jgi:UDP-N-acetylglucosamine/UDP-N-acetylgalactosamine diphosphorylase
MIPSELLQRLHHYNQEHLLQYYYELAREDQVDLVRQLESINFEVLKLIENKDQQVLKGEIAPLGALSVKEIVTQEDTFRQSGLDAIRQCKIAAVLLAGGQGSRLGFEHPKGMLNLGETKELFLFEQLVKNLLEVVREADTWVPLLVMTSEKNNDETIAFFIEHNFFGYKQEYVRFFTQEMAPSADFNGKIYLEAKGIVSLSPNGNGGWFSSLVKANLLPTLKQWGVEWLNIFSVDNPLQKIADPLFVGATLTGNYVCASKVVRKAAPEERVGVLCLEDGKPSIVEYFELTKQMIHERDEKGDLLYNYGVILNYLFRVDRLEAILEQHLPLHIVQKKIPYLNEQCELITPQANNGYKFETLVLDMIRLMDNCLSFEVLREKEFAPIKNKDGVDSLDTSRALLKQNGIEL